MSQIIVEPEDVVARLIGTSDFVYINCHEILYDGETISGLPTLTLGNDAVEIIDDSLSVLTGNTIKVQISHVAVARTRMDISFATSAGGVTKETYIMFRTTHTPGDGTSVVTPTDDQVEEIDARLDALEAGQTGGVYFNVLTYGAVGDGVTDDTTSIRNAVANGGEIIFPNGIYIIDGDALNENGTAGGISLQSNTHIILSPNAILKRKSSSSAYGTILRLQGVSNVTIEGGSIDGNRAGFSVVSGSGEWNYCIGVFGGSNIRITDTILKNSYGDGLILERGQDSSTPTNITVRNVTADNNRRNGCSVVDLAQAHFENCDFKNTNGTAPQAGMDIEPGVVTRLVSDVTITNCRFTGNTARGLDVQGFNGYVENVVINACIAKDNSGAGFSFYQCTLPVLLSNSIADGNNLAATDISGISVIDSTGIIISANTAINNTYSGISVLGTSSQITLANNQCRSNTRHGIFAAAANHSIMNNTCNSNQQYGIYGYDLTDSMIKGNTCIGNSQVTDNTYDGIQLANISVTNFLEGNICRRGAGVKQQRYGVRIGVSGGRANMVSGNDLLTGGKTAAYSDADSNTLSQNNRIS